MSKVVFNIVILGGTAIAPVWAFKGYYLPLFFN